MKLYHFTSVGHISRILDVGLITTTNSNIWPDGGGPPVVWLTKNDSHKQEWAHGAAEGILTKWGIRITVDIPKNEAHPWPAWSKEREITKKWYDALDRVSGGNAKNWYVVERPIQKDEWAAVEMWHGFLQKHDRGYSEEMFVAFLESEAGKKLLATPIKTIDVRGARPTQTNEFHGTAKIQQGGRTVKSSSMQPVGRERLDLLFDAHRKRVCR